jgi:hypothetical protein
MPITFGYLRSSNKSILGVVKYITPTLKRGELKWNTLVEHVTELRSQSTSITPSKSVWTAVRTL